MIVFKWEVEYMPIYSYICKNCGEGFDLLVGVTSDDTELKCKKCKSNDVKKIISSFSVGGVDNDSGYSGSCPTGTCPV